LLCVPLLAACPTFSVGPEAYELPVTAAACEAKDLAADCTTFALDNGTIFTAATRQSVALRLGFEAPARNLAYVALVFEVPGRPPIRRTCAIPAEPLSNTEDHGCASIGLGGNGSGVSGDPAGAAEGVLHIEAVLLAPEPGSYAISVWLTDDEGLDSPVVRWQFPVVEPQRPLPEDEE
jgi:hypothetical protein